MPAPTASPDRATDRDPAFANDAVQAPARRATGPESWRWVRWMLGSLATACIAVATFNAAIDPSGRLGTGVLDPISRLARDRAAKVELLRAATDTQLVVLGSSRAKQLDPRDIDPDARHPINAALVGGDLFEERVLATWLGDRADDGVATFPHLVVGVDVEGFRGRSLRGSGLLAVDDVRGIAKRAAGSPSMVELAPDAGELLLTLETTRASWRTMRLQLRQRSKVRANLHGEDATMQVRDFDEAGLPIDTRDWLDADAVAGLTRRTRAAIAPSIERYRSNYREQGPTLAPDSVEDLTELLEVAVAHGDTPLVFISPAHPRFVSALDGEGRAARHARLLALLRQLAADGSVQFIDCSTCVPGADRYWLDGAHTSPLGAKVLAEQLGTNG